LELAVLVEVDLELIFFEAISMILNFGEWKVEMKGINCLIGVPEFVENK